MIIAIGIGDSEAYRYSVEESQIVNALSRGRLAAGGVEEVSRELAHGARDNLNDLTDRCFNHSTVSIGRPGVRVNRWFSVAMDCSNTQDCIVNSRAKTEVRFLAVARKSPLRFEGAEAVSFKEEKKIQIYPSGTRSRVAVIEPFPMTAWEDRVVGSSYGAALANDYNAASSVPTGMVGGKPLIPDYPNTVELNVVGIAARHQHFFSAHSH